MARLCGFNDQPFFVMLVLYVFTVVILKKKEKALMELEYNYQAIQVKAKQFERIQEIEKALTQLDDDYFEYDDKSKRYRLKVDVRFTPNSADIYQMDEGTRGRLVEAGKSLSNLLKEITSENPNVNYLLIVEGNTQWVKLTDRWNYELIPNLGYELSYKRALALSNFWKTQQLDFNKIGNCEIMLVGSGYFGKSRDNSNKGNNRKFSIQITAKVWDIIE